MSIRDLISYRDRLDRVFEQGKGIRDPEMQSHWAKYLTVLVSGFIEVAVREIYTEYARTRATPEITNYVKNHLEGFQNAKMEKIYLVTRSFSPAWEKILRGTAAGKIEDAINSVVANRHLIAHGRSVGVSFGTITGWYASIKLGVQSMANQCGIQL